MAAYGGHSAVEGIQLFVTLRKGAEWPPLTTDLRIRYEQTLGDVRAAVERAMGVPGDKQLLFHHKRELTSEDDAKTLLDLDIHTGFQLQGYDLTVEPVFWPPVKKTPAGLVLDC